MKHRIQRFSETLACATIGTILVSCAAPGGRDEIALFNGKDLEGWNYVLQDPEIKREQVWSVRDGVLTCWGTPVGVLYKDPEVSDFRLIVEYRWAPGAEPGNSGVFSRISKPATALPKAIEVQLKHGSAGDVIGLQGKKVAAGQPRFIEIKNHPLAGDITGVQKTVNAENPAGEWNRLDITASGEAYTVRLNGKLVNEVRGVEISAGPVGLQSEGGIIQFRRVMLIPKAR